MMYKIIEGEDPLCQVCAQPVAIRFKMEHTGYCDGCAQTLITPLLELASFCLAPYRTIESSTEYLYQIRQKARVVIDRAKYGE